MTSTYPQAMSLLLARAPRAAIPKHIDRMHRCQAHKLSTTTASAHTSPPNTPSPPMTWNDYFTLRRARRRTNLAAAVGTTTLTLATTIPIIAAQDLEVRIAAATGLDPLISMGLTVTALAGTAWLSGPLVGNLLFNLRHRANLAQIKERDRVFWTHVKRYRADPSGTTINSPVPDYYCEKVASVAGYRTWLKDQRAFMRKTTKNLI